MAIHCAAAEHGGLIKTERKKRIKFMGKTKVGRPNNNNKKLIRR